MFKYLAVFVRAVDLGSFTAAARHFQLTPAAVSKQVRMLEDDLGVRLLDRTTRQLNLTEAGSRFYGRANRILAELEEARDEANSLQTAPRGNLRISAPLSFSIAHLGPLVADYMATYPEISVDLELNDRKVDLVEEGFDVAIRIGWLADSSLVARKLARCRFVLCAAPEYLQRHGHPGTPGDLSQHACLHYSQPGYDHAWHLKGPDGEVAVPVTGRLLANNGLFLREALLSGLGIGLSPMFIVGEDLKAGRLIPLLPEYEAPESGIYAVYPERRYQPPKVRSFIDFLANRISGLSTWEA